MRKYSIYGGLFSIALIILKSAFTNYNKCMRSRYAVSKYSKCMQPASVSIFTVNVRDLHIVELYGLSVGVPSCKVMVLGTAHLSRH